MEPKLGPELKPSDLLFIDSTAEVPTSKPESDSLPMSKIEITIPNPTTPQQQLKEEKNEKVDKSMDCVDMVVGLVNDDNTSYVRDYYSISQIAPQTDEFLANMIH
ncbi:hypothetical protein DINM_006886 [Dirofilaria immitis]|nr:hypothetical protein [Dirofilaria immitis]